MKNTIRILVIVAIGVLLFCISSFLFSALLPSDNMTETTGSSDVPANNNPDSFILEQTEDAGQEYVDKLYFVGDSTTYHFFKGGIDRSHLLVPESLTLMLSSDILSITVRNTDLTIPEALKEANAEYVIITIGVNGADNFRENQFKTYYLKLINAIKAESPNTKIILQSVFPVTKEYSDRDIGITNEGIDRINEWVKKIAQEANVKYLDTQSILKDENGAQRIEYNEDDGVHMNAQAYTLILNYIRTHAYK
jgi:lysophospholipase L1-like esterase